MELLAGEYILHKNAKESIPGAVRVDPAISLVQQLRRFRATRAPALWTSPLAQPSKRATAFIVKIASNTEVLSVQASAGNTYTRDLVHQGFLNRLFVYSAHNFNTIPVGGINGIKVIQTSDFSDAAVVTFNLSVSGTATSDTDYAAIAANAQITVANGSSTGTLTVQVSDDALLERSASFCRPTPVPIRSDR